MTATASSTAPHSTEPTATRPQPAPEHNGDTFAAVMEGVRRIGVETARRAEEIDAQRAYPRDLWRELEETGVFRSLRPKKYGGLELSLGQVNQLTIEGARYNGSLGWLLMIGTAQGIGLGNWPQATALRMIDEFPRLRTRGIFAPKGTATPTDGGYIVSGQWPFASGGPDPDFVSGNCVVVQDGAPVIGQDGAPTLVAAIMRAADLEPIDTWHVLGMRGTDSKDYAAREVFVPKDMTLDLFAGKRNFFETSTARLPIRVTLAAAHASVALGVAQGALCDVTELAKTKRAAMNPSALLADDPIFRHELGEQTLRFTAVKAMLDRLTDDFERDAGSGRELTPNEILIGRSMAGYITRECVTVVDACYHFAGSASVYDGSSLQRRMRDIHVATQHISTSPETYRVVGAAVLGIELPQSELF